MFCNYLIEACHSVKSILWNNNDSNSREPFKKSNKQSDSMEMVNGCGLKFDSTRSQKSPITRVPRKVDECNCMDGVMNMDCCSDEDDIPMMNGRQSLDEIPMMNGSQTLDEIPERNEPLRTSDSINEYNNNVSLHSIDCGIFELHQGRMCNTLNNNRRFGIFGWFRSGNKKFFNRKYNSINKLNNKCNVCLGNYKSFPNDINLKSFELGPTVGTGSYATVCLAKYKDDPDYPPLALKILHKNKIILEKHVHHVRNERDILSSINHPFIVHYYKCFQDDFNIYIILEYLCGGEMFSYIHKYGVLDIDYARFYASEIILAIDYLHANNIIYRDLKPENVLLDIYGHIRLVDFGFSKLIKNKTYTLCGTHEYLAPEIFLNKGHKYEVDWWSFGILLYEILVGKPPFHSDDPTKTYDLALENNIFFPTNITNDAKDLIKSLLIVNPNKRIGSKDPSEIYSHPFFKDINWKQVLLKNTQPPILPDVTGLNDTKNYYRYPETWELYSLPITIAQQNKYFSNF